MREFRKRVGEIRARNRARAEGKNESGRASLPAPAFIFCAQDWIRTSTSLRTLRPEHSASTNFATWACSGTRDAKISAVLITNKRCRTNYITMRLQPLSTAWSIRPNTWKVPSGAMSPMSSVAMNEQE